MHPIFSGVNPFDQPDVEATKVNTRKLIAGFHKTRTWPAAKPRLCKEDLDVYGNVSGPGITHALNEFLENAPANAYAGIQVFLSPSNKLYDALQDLRTAITRRYKLAVTVGYGPRYLHSTGQLHKGDAGRGLFIQLTGSDETDLAIPDQPKGPGSSLTFGELKAAQAAADFQALADLGRKIIRIHFKKDPVAGLINLIENI